MRTTRRSFVKAIGFGLLAPMPSLRLLEPRQQHIDLSLFCDAHEERDSSFNLGKPFEQDGQIYATDGMIAVRTEGPISSATESCRLPNMSGLPWWNMGVGDWKAWPRQRWISADAVRYSSSPFKSMCPACHGRRRVGVLHRCEKCSGRKKLTEECVACFGCGFTGGDWCEYCDAKGTTERPTIQCVGPCLVHGMLDWKIRTLAGVEYKLCAASDESAIRFRFDGGEGLLAPLYR